MKIRVCFSLKNKILLLGSRAEGEISGKIAQESLAPSIPHACFSLLGPPIPLPIRQSFGSRVVSLPLFNSS